MEAARRAGRSQSPSILPIEGDREYRGRYSRSPIAERRYRREYSRGLGDSQLDYEDEEEEPIPDWVFAMLWWPVSILGFVLRIIGRFSKLAFLLSVSAATYFWIYSAMVPPSLSEHHPINFEYPALHSERHGGVPANATVDFAFQRQLMLRSGARGMDWSSGMAPGSSLDVGVSLELPECQANYDVGTFTINITVYDKQGQAVAKGTRSLVLQHKSALLQTLSTLTFSVPLVMALTSEHQVVSGTAVQLVSLPKGGLHSAWLSLSDSRLQIYSASVDITFVLTGFRYYMFHWFLTSMAVGTVIVSNLYVAAIGWLSKRIFGASFDVDEELGGARKSPHRRYRKAGSAGQREAASGRRSRYTHGGAGGKGDSRRRRQASRGADGLGGDLEPQGAGPHRERRDALKQRGASRSEGSGSSGSDDGAGDGASRAGAGRSRRGRDGSEGALASGMSGRSCSGEEWSASEGSSELDSRPASSDLDDLDADWRTRKTSDTSASAGRTRKASGTASAAEESEACSPSSCRSPSAATSNAAQASRGSSLERGAGAAAVGAGAGRDDAEARSGVQDDDDDGMRGADADLVDLADVARAGARRRHAGSQAAAAAAEAGVSFD